MRVWSSWTRGGEEAKLPGCVDHAQDCWLTGNPKERCMGGVRSEWTPPTAPMHPGGRWLCRLSGALPRESRVSFPLRHHRL